MARSVISYRNRNKTDIAIQILETANGGGVTKYQISYEASLNYSQLNEILPMLIENGLAMNQQQKCVHLRLLKKVLHFFKPTIR
jgi:predicted transcriptional regulator